MYCADCGGKMYVHRVNNGKRDPQFTCSQYSKYPIGSLCPTQHRIRAEAVLTLITDMLRAIAGYSKNDRAEFIRTVQETQAAQQTADISKNIALIDKYENFDTLTNTMLNEFVEKIRVHECARKGSDIVKIS